MDKTSLGFQKPREEEYYDINIFNQNAQLANDLIEKNSSAIGQIALQKSENKVTVFDSNGSITETIKNGDTILRIKTITFPSSTQIVETTLENAVTTVKTTTFNADGTIKEEVA